MVKKRREAKEGKEKKKQKVKCKIEKNYFAYNIELN